MDDLTIQQQSNSRTFAGRNDRFFQALGRSLNTAENQPVKVLSFGCSTGEECLDLARILPDVKIFGTDIKDSALQEARQKCPPEITLFLSREAAIQNYGPYDAITAMSVFCLWPTTLSMKNIAQVYPFATFEAGLRNLFPHLKLGGIFLLQNGQYMMEDTVLADKFEPIEAIICDSSGWIFKCTPDGNRVTTTMIDYNGRLWGQAEFTEAFRDKIEIATAPLEFRVIHHWHDERERNGRNADIALWRKISE